MIKITSQSAHKALESPSLRSFGAGLVVNKSSESGSTVEGALGAGGSGSEEQASENKKEKSIVDPRRNEGIVI